MSSLAAILLRVLLSVVLIFNGSGYAYAATQMHTTSTAAASDANDRDMRDHGAGVHAASPCHEATGEEMSAPAPPADGLAGHDGHDRTNCCQGDQCDCVCAQHVPATSLAFWLRSPLLVRSRVPAYRPVEHLAPALPHLQRPPIG
jgi:hypothetical protein